MTDSTQSQLVLARKNQLEWQEQAVPTIEEPGQALVRPLAVARCDLDIPILRGETLIRGPFPVGHEFTAEITELSEDMVGQFQVGQKVIVAFQISCGTCPHCVALHSHACGSVPFTSAYGLGKLSREWGGALTEIIRVPYAKQMLVPLPEGVSPVATASLSDNMVDAWRTVGPHLKMNPNQSVLVVGGIARSIGLYAAKMAQLYGAQRVVYLDKIRENLEMAEKLGLDVVEVDDYPKSYESFDLVVDAGSTPKSLDTSLRSLGVEGICTTTAIHFNNKTPIPFLDMYNKGATLKTGRPPSRETIPEILDLIQNRGFKPEEMTTKVVGWHDAKDAWAEDGIKLVVAREGVT